VPISDLDGDVGGSDGNGGWHAGGAVAQGGGGGSAGQGGESALACDGDEWICGGRCVDLDSDAFHCGQCGHQCPSQICIDGACKGGPTGHLVVAGMSFASSTAPARRILGNAVFLPSPHTVRILDYRAHAEPTVADNVDAIIAAQAQQRGRAVIVSEAPSAAAIGEALDIDDFDVLFIHDQPGFPPGQAQPFAKKAGDSMARFFSDGGTVVVLATSAPMADLLSETALLDTLGFISIAGSTVHKSAPTDAISIGVVAPMLAVADTTLIVTAELPTPDMSFVFSDDSPVAHPVVIHRVFDVE
jgi:hypothetical protein